MSRLPDDFRGIVPPLCTPLTATGEVDLESVERHVNFQIEAGVHGIFMLGSSGEAILLNVRQRVQVLETAARAAAGRVPVLAGILDTGTARSIEHARNAEQAGVDALVLTAPFYFKVNQDELLEHFRAVRRATSLPLMGYDLPTVLGVKIERPTALQLAREGTIDGIKDSSGDQDGFRSLVVAARDLPSGTCCFTFTGSEFMVDMALLMGASGAVPGLSNVDPHAYIRLYNAIQAGDLTTARQEQERLMRLFQIVHAGTAGRMSFLASALGGFKTAIMLRGNFSTNIVGQPFTPYNEEEVERVRGILAAEGLIS
jgi:4-hydroxy-tetrahydrodipicolinate synthase